MNIARKAAVATALSAGGANLTGQMAAAKLGSMAGEALYNAGGKLYSWLVGNGDYQLNSNSLLQGGGTTSETVQIQPVGNRAIRVTYKEYLGDVFTHPSNAGQFYNTSYPINPGLPGVFPWLSTLANQYETWEPLGIVFEFRSTSSEYVATQALGSVIMATEYDTREAAFPNKQAMLNSAYSSEAKPSSQILHGVECAPNDKVMRQMYTRFGALPTGVDPHDYDLGIFQIASQGGATANLNLGSLYVHYDIIFRKEQLYAGLQNHTQLMAVFTGTTGFNSTNFLGTSPVTVWDPIGMQITGQQIIFPSWVIAGTWILIYHAEGSSGAITYPTITASQGAVANTTQWNTGSEYLNSGGGLTSSVLHQAYAFTISSASGSGSWGAKLVMNGQSMTSCTKQQLMIINIGPQSL